MIDKLNPHYSMENPATIYDEEALTALQLAARTTSKVNEVVEAQNKLAKDTADHLDEQDERLDVFQTDTIPNTVVAEVEQHINNGSFDEQIDRYAGNLEARVDNLLGSLKTGSTTGDAELIDSRTDHHGKTHENVGAHIRALTAKPGFLDTDLIKARYQSLIPETYAETVYNGTDLWCAFGTHYFDIEKGDYMLVVPDSNAHMVILKPAASEDRWVSTTEPNGANYFSVSDEKVTAQLVFYISLDTAKPAGKYYAHFYLYKMVEGQPILPDYLMDTTDLITMCNHGTKVYNNITHGYGGSNLWEGVDTPSFTLEPGNYKLILSETNFIGAYVVQIHGGASNRLVDVSNENGVGGCYPFTVEHGDPVYVRLNCSLGVANNTGTYVVKKMYVVKDNGKPIIPGDLTGFAALAAKINTQAGVEGRYFAATADTLTADNALEIAKTVNVKKNKTLIFTCDVDSFGGVRVGHGKGSYGGNYLEVNASGIRVYSVTDSTTQVSTHTHGLTISRFLTVVVQVGVGTADITLFTANGSYTARGVKWSGSNGRVFAEPVVGSVAKAVLKWTTSDITSPVWVFGDSYLGLTDGTRYPYHLLNMGFNNWLASGFPGGNAAAELDSLKSLLEIGCPNILVWCVGMNNGDSGAVNANWNACYNELKTLCDNAGVELVLSTIPSVPTVDNTYKNDVVRNSGYRYIDFNKAVVVSGTTWVNGALSADGVHPTELGAKILANRFIVDVPEITL